MCSFCAELENDYINSYYLSKISKSSMISNRIIYETANWVVFPTIGPLKQGHLLITTKKHYSCIRNTPKEIIYELYDIIETYRKIFKDLFNSSLIAFEHGNSDGFSGGTCVDHSHIHIVPHNNDLLIKLEENHFEISKLNSLFEISCVPNANNGYLYYLSPSNKEYVLTSEIIPSQFFRQLLAVDCEVSEIWDWRNHPRIELFRETYNSLSKYK